MNEEALCECCSRLINLDVEKGRRFNYKIYPPKHEMVDVEDIYGFTIYCSKGFYALVPSPGDHAIVCGKCWKDYGLEDD
jgi:hypothetical protein